jgi:hypothetical protein
MRVIAEGSEFSRIKTHINSLGPVYSDGMIAYSSGSAVNVISADGSLLRQLVIRDTTEIGECASVLPLLRARKSLLDTSNTGISPQALNPSSISQQHRRGMAHSSLLLIVTALCTV